MLGQSHPNPNPRLENLNSQVVEKEKEKDNCLVLPSPFGGVSKSFRNNYPNGRASRKVTTGTMLTNAQAKVADVCWMPRRKQYWVSEALQQHTDNKSKPID